VEQREEIFGVEELASFLKVDPKTVQYLSDIKRLPYFKVGRLIRFRRSAIEEWAKSREIYPEIDRPLHQGRHGT
jgi:excisionase family DNA binding protein